MVMAGPIRILCVDDNEHVAQAVELKVRRTEGMLWLGRLPDASALVTSARALTPDVVLLDLDMPGPSPITVTADLAAALPRARVLVVSGHLRRELIEQALDAGAWGYVYKGESITLITEAISAVAKGEVFLSPEVQAAALRV